MFNIDISWPSDDERILQVLKEFENRMSIGDTAENVKDVAVKLARRIILLEAQFKALSREYSELRRMNEVADEVAEVGTVESDRVSSEMQEVLDAAWESFGQDYPDRESQYAELIQFLAGRLDKLKQGGN